MLEHQFRDFVRTLDQRTVADLVQDHLADYASVRSAAVEDRAGLAHLGLGREDVCSGPARHGAELAERAEIEHRLVADHLVLISANPEQRCGLRDVAKGLVLHHAGEIALLTPRGAGPTPGQFGDG